MIALPTGTLTMLFSDIEGSTALLHRLGPAWGDALSAQRQILRAAFQAHDGVEMGTEGDSFFVVFTSARDAVRAAVDGQRGLHAHDWPGDRPVRVRMGLHTGEPERHEDGYIGADVHRAARIGSTAHGGQIVVSAATRALAGELLGAAFRDLGRHRLKDLAGDEHLFDVSVDGLPDRFAPLRSLGRAAALPTPPTPLVGRERELGEVAALLADPRVRLVTFTGPGGAGKTRLAIASAIGPGSEYADGVWFVPLSAATDAATAWAHVAEALDVDAGQRADPAAAALGYLAARSALLVLDNLEHLPDADAMVASLLSGAPRVRVLATSRRALLLAAEREFPVGPLPVTSSPGSDSPQAPDDAPAVQLFVQQARAVRPAFTLDESNGPDVAELCRRLDGLPLAIELAAAHLRLLTPRALLARLDTTLSTLGAGVTAADRPERQRTLGATIAWSHDLLPASDRTVFRRLGVFAGPADLDAVAEVAAPFGADSGTDEGAEGAEEDVYAVAARLVGTSLVSVVPGADGEPRLALLETIRGFARERLEAAGELDDVRLRHLRWCAGATERAVTRLRGALHTHALDELAAIEDDVRTALDYALRTPHPHEPAARAAERVDLGRRLLVDITTRYWYSYGSVAEARGWQERGLALGGGRAGGSVHGAEDADSFWLLHGLGIALVQAGELGEAEQLFARALDLAQRLGDLALQSRALNDQAIARRQADDVPQARALLERALEVADAAGDPKFQAISLANLVVVHIDAGDYAAAAGAVRRSMELNAAQGNHFDLAVDRVNLTAALLRSEGAASAHARYREWAPSVLGFRDNQLTVDLVEVGAAVATGLGAASTAARLLGAADTLRAEHRMPRSDREKALTNEWLADARTALTEAGWDAAYADGRRLTASAAVDEVCGLSPAGVTARA